MKIFLFLFLFFGISLFGEDTLIILEGYLGVENISFAQEKLNGVRDQEGGRFIIQVNSSSGDLRAALSLAQEIYDIKLRRNKYVIVYIDGKAVGPAAIFPFLADELITTPLVAWGDVPYGVKSEMTETQMRGAVLSLINKDRNLAPTLMKLVDAMVDPHYQLIYQNGQGEIEKEKNGLF